jgi:hypothetical protein
MISPYQRPKRTAAPNMQCIYSSVSKASLQKTGVLLNSAMQCIYSSVSKASLQKTGVLLDSAGDFWEFSAQKVRTSVSRDYWR